MEKLLQQVENDINEYGNVRPATLKTLEKVMKEHQNLDGRTSVSAGGPLGGKGLVSNVKNYFHKL